MQEGTQKNKRKCEGKESKCHYANIEDKKDKQTDGQRKRVKAGEERGERATACGGRGASGTAGEQPG